jgi:uncharacterized membrane protein
MTTTLPTNLKQKTRLTTIDFVRGIVLLLMALDHTRLYFGEVPLPPNLADADPTLFWTRWITHFCAPTFIFLAGVSAFLYQNKQAHTASQTSYLLATRGFWFLLVGLFVMPLTWTFLILPYSPVLEVFGAIGLSMLALSLLVYLPSWAILLVGITLVIGHNLLDTISAASLGNWSNLWILLHEKGIMSFADYQIRVIYPILPWIGVMALGYTTGTLFLLPETTRRRYFISMGIIALFLFAVIRYSNLYGDPHLWSVEHSVMKTIMSFVNCMKYPPSLLYVLVTLGPMFLLLGLLSEKFCDNALAKKVITYGKVPFLFYMTHIPLILTLALFATFLLFDLSAVPNYFETKLSHGYGLWAVYATWIVVIALLYYPCSRYGRFKAKTKGWVWRYL